jgi:hypothetical protein
LNLTGVSNLITIISGIDLYSALGGEWYSYGGGPKSIFGIGRTSHKRWIDSQDITEGVIARPLPDIDIPISSPSSVPIISSTALSGLPRNLKELEGMKDLGLTIGKGIGRVGSRNRKKEKIYI